MWRKTVRYKHSDEYNVRWKFPIFRVKSSEFFYNNSHNGLLLFKTQISRKRMMRVWVFWDRRSGLVDNYEGHIPSTYNLIKFLATSLVVKCSSDLTKFIIYIEITHLIWNAKFRKIMFDRCIGTSHVLEVHMF